jgi:DNA-binding HxlR family transcriptional regulator
LALLLNEIRSEILKKLMEHGPMLRRELKDQTAQYLSPSAFGHTLGKLRLAGLITSRPGPRDQREKLYELTSAAKELLLIALEVRAVEAWAPRDLRGPHSPLLMKALADEYARMIPRELVDGPLPYTELRSRLPELSGSAFANHLALLVKCGLVRVRPGSRPKERVYELTELAPALARAAALAARLRLHMTPEDAPWLTGDLPSFLRLLELAPALRAPREARGTVLLHVINHTDTRGWPFVEIALEHGRITQRRPGIGQPHATVRAPPLAWWDAILATDFASIEEIEGDVELVHTLLAAISASVNSCPRI